MLMLLHCISIIQAMDPLACRGAIEVQTAKQPPCKISDFHENPDFIHSDFEREKVTFSRTFSAIAEDGKIHTETQTVTLFPDKCHHDLKKDGSISRYKGSPHCKECKETYDEWLKETKGTRALLEVFGDWHIKDKG